MQTGALNAQPLSLAGTATFAAGAFAERETPNRVANLAIYGDPDLLLEPSTMADVISSSSIRG